MNPIAFAMRHPITTMMLVVALIGGGGLALTSMRVDIFPPFNIPQIYVVQNFNGMSPGQMEGLIVNQFELNFQYVDGVKSVESRSVQQIALIKLSFYPGTNMAQAMAEVVAQANRAQASMPPGVLPPQIMRMDGGSVPTGYLVLTSRTESLGALADYAQQRVRPLVQEYIPGTVGTAPFGSNVRAIVVNVDPDRLRSYQLTTDDVVQALMTGNVITPAGNLYIRDQMPLVPTNSMVVNIQEIRKIPLKMGRNVYINDVATVEDSTDINFGYALVNGRRSVYIPIVKKNTASTLTVTSEIYNSLPIFQNALPKGVTISYEFDESPTVVEAIKSVAMEGAIGAVLTGLMILIFLRDWRSVLVVVFNIPMAITGALLALWLTGATINIMTLGGLALSIGMLVDEATVTIENIHVQMNHTPSLARSVERAGNETAVARLLAMLCILSVFIPAFIMAEPVRSLFVPLSLAVGFAMITSYFLSSTLVPVLSVWMLKHHGGHRTEESKDFFERLIQPRFAKLVEHVVTLRAIIVPTYLGVCVLILVVVGMQVGRELFPQVDSGEFVLRFRAPPGTNFELTREMAVRCLQVIGDEAGDNNIKISMGFAGQQAPNYGMNNMLLFMRGPDDGQLRVQLMEDSGVRLDEFRKRLRKALPDKIRPWFAEVLQKDGMSRDQALARVREITFAFEPGDIVSEVMSFGAPAPIEVMVASPNLDDAREYATRILKEMEKIPFLRDLQFQQTLDYPAVPVNIDRQKAGLSGVTVDQVGRSLVVATSSSRLVARNYWQDPRSGVSYQVQVQVPVQRMTKTTQVETLSLEQSGPQSNLMIRDVASVSSGVMPGEYDRSAMQRYLSITANVEGEDLGRASRQLDAALKRAGEEPRGVRVQVRGQITPMREMFRSLEIGLGIAVIVILVLLTAYFESLRLAIVSVGAVPGVLSGVVLILYLTGTTLNIESFMGTIMCIGVSVSNSVMLVTFIARDWYAGQTAREAALSGARERLRPILMTACAMIVGMIPMALGLEKGSQMEAPLGRAVIGGLLVSTFATLLILPAIFSVVMGQRQYHSPSVHPDDPVSKHFHQETEHDAT
ncbi:MAG: efflux RND transporter permease subunit [Planctomycetes bacterium]|nr:efflux RND transporter permease subunit [Planctomycetota bacterium]